MSGRIRLALCAWLATLLAATALIPLVEPTSWLLQAAALLGVQTAVGALARRVPLSRGFTVFAQLLVTVLLLTASFAGDRALLGFVPGPDTLNAFAELLRDGGDDAGRYAPPVPLSDGIRLMLVSGVLLIGLVVDLFAVTLRSAAPAGLPLLALYSVAAGIAGGDAGWAWFLLAAVGYLLLLLAEGRDRLAQWGRVFGGPVPTRGGPVTAGMESGRATVRVRTGHRIGALALGIAVVVPLALPSLDGGLLDRERGGTGDSEGGTISAVNPLVSLQNSLNQPEDREVLKYTTSTPDTQELYLRIVALDDFDGSAWKPSQREVTDVPAFLPTPPGLSPEVARRGVTTRIEAADWYAQDWLPMPFPASRVDIDGQWRFEPVGRTLVGDHEQTTRGARYTVESLIVEPTAQQLANAPAPPPEFEREFTKVPASLPDEVAEQARKVTAGASNDYERAVKLQEWFAFDGGFTYDTEVTAGTGSAAIARFLQQKQGFCVHFSFAMAAMARTLGIPARVAVGFTPGSPGANGEMSVGLKDAHAWPELYFEGVGWTRFEPTPSRGSAPDYTRPEAPSAAPSTEARPTESASDAPSTAPSETESCSAEQKRLDGSCGTTAPAVAAGSSGDGGPRWQAVLIGAGVLAALALPFLPMLWRSRVRARRLGSSPGRTEADAQARTLAAWRELVDTAWDHGIGPDASETPRAAAARIVRVARLDESAAGAVRRVAEAVEQTLYAPVPRPVTGLGDEVRTVRGALRAAVGRGARVRALWVPRSAVRVVWAVAERWTGLRVRVSGAVPSWAGALRR
ncbi:transglutaminaseTgpA domain-containing protein [Streptomyces sp. NPDC059578]|uniref:transglutaminaseTgpA domain-containing protein n=1 Tax=Streptomyces sp. NPDC059578 TaxID=3346874 RepID=UPI0036C87FAB